MGNLFCHRCIPFKIFCPLHICNISNCWYYGCFQPTFQLFSWKFLVILLSLNVRCWMKHSTVCFTEIQWLFIYWIVEVQFLKVINYFRYKIWMLWKWWNMRFKFFSVSDAGWRQCSSLPQDCWLRNSECLEFEKCWRSKMQKLNNKQHVNEIRLLCLCQHSYSASCYLCTGTLKRWACWRKQKVIPYNMLCRQPTHIVRCLNLPPQFLQWLAASVLNLMWVNPELSLKTLRMNSCFSGLECLHCTAVHSPPSICQNVLQILQGSWWFDAWSHTFLPQDRLSLGSATPRLVSLNFGLNIVENLSLLGLSFVPSSDVFELHEAFFITFMGTSMISMVLTVFYLYPHCGFQPRSGDERRAIGYKKKLVKTSLGAAALALYFYWRHNEYCEPYVYSFFGLFEYVIVLCNIGYHGMVSLDFADSSVRTGPDQILLK